MKKQVTCILFGEVQGVFYRRFVKEAADKRRLVGSVRNCRDGTVEVIAEGEETLLREFLRELKETHPRARVKHSNEVWSNITGTFSDFRMLAS